MAATGEEAAAADAEQGIGLVGPEAAMLAMAGSVAFHEHIPRHVAESADAVAVADVAFGHAEGDGERGIAGLADFLQTAPLVDFRRPFLVPDPLGNLRTPVARLGGQVDERAHAAGSQDHVG